MTLCGEYGTASRQARSKWRSRTKRAALSQRDAQWHFPASLAARAAKSLNESLSAGGVLAGVAQRVRSATA
jgi:hypothetical protein